MSPSRSDLTALLASRPWARPRRFCRRASHLHEAGPFKVLHQPVRGDLRHYLIGLVNALLALEAEHECQAAGNLVSSRRAAGPRGKD